MNLTTVLSSAKKGAAFLWINREIVMGVSIVVLIALLLHRPPTVTNTVKIIDPLTLQQLNEQKDINGKLYVTIQQSILEKNQLGKLADSLAKALKIKPKFIIGATIVKVKIDTQYRDTGSTKIVVVNGDSIHLVQHHDPWLDITAFAYTNPKNWHLDHIDFHLTDSLYFIQTYKAPFLGFIGRPIYEVIVKSANQSSHIIAGSSFTVRQKVPWLILGLGGGYQLLPVQSYSLGIYVVTPIISLKR